MKKHYYFFMLMLSFNAINGCAFKLPFQAESIIPVDAISVKQQGDFSLVSLAMIDNNIYIPNDNDDDASLDVYDMENSERKIVDITLFKPHLTVSGNNFIYFIGRPSFDDNSGRYQYYPIARIPRFGPTTDISYALAIANRRTDIATYIPEQYIKKDTSISIESESIGKSNTNFSERDGILFLGTPDSRFLTAVNVINSKFLKISDTNDWREMMTVLIENNVILKGQDLALSGSSPNSITFSEVYGKLFISFDKEPVISIVDSTSLEEVSTIDLSTLKNDAGYHRLAVINPDDGEEYLFAVDIENRKLRTFSFGESCDTENFTICPISEVEYFDPPKEILGQNSINFTLPTINGLAGQVMAVETKNSRLASYKINRSGKLSFSNIATENVGLPIRLLIADEFSDCFGVLSQQDVTQDAKLLLYCKDDFSYKSDDT